MRFVSDAGSTFAVAGNKSSAARRVCKRQLLFYRAMRTRREARTLFFARRPRGARNYRGFLDFLYGLTPFGAKQIRTPLVQDVVVDFPGKLAARAVHAARAPRRAHELLSLFPDFVRHFDRHNSVILQWFTTRREIY
jgi:hypothetical protein